MIYELQILLGLNCNFKCSHCLNSSSPGNREQDLSDSEASLLSEVITSDKSIKTVSFSGGEPLLYISRIEHFVLKLRAVRPDLLFSITTNGSLIENHKDLLSILNLDYAILSFDKEHSEFIKSDKFVDALQISKNIFKNFEINVTYSESPHIDSIKHFLLENNIKVNFTHSIESGRNQSKCGAPSARTLTQINCPNIEKSGKFTKVTFIPKKGFTICCGPVIFDQIIDDSISFFSNFNLLKENILYKFLKKTEQVQVFTGTGGGCTSCKAALLSTKPGELEFFAEKSPWNNVLTTWDYKELDHFNKLFNPKIIKKVDVGQFNNYLVNENSSDLNLQKYEGDNLPPSEIDDFSKFTIQTFYDVHTEYYSIGDIVRFKNDQKIFFNLPNKYIYHKINEQIVGYLAVCKLELHPLFKERAWHIGYWGISQGLDDISREKIKSDWAKLLSYLNLDSIIAANIDYFNTPADKLSTKFNFKPICVRLDPRQ